MLYSKWLGLSLGTRQQIALRFGIAKVRPIHVANNTIADDGFNVKDVENAITVEALQEYLESKETDINKLFDTLVDKIEGRVTEVAEETIVAEELPQEEVKQFQDEFESRTGIVEEPVGTTKKLKVVKKTNGKTKKTSTK